MVLAQNKKKNSFPLLFFTFLAVAGGLFFLTSSVAMAGLLGPTGIPIVDLNLAVSKKVGVDIVDIAGNMVLDAFKWLLYYVFVAVGWLVSAALTLFEWAIDPSYISGPKSFFNAVSTYESWKFIRDFFNLFFILSLLYLAFTTIFQVAKDYKKSLLTLVIMALLVNFSFPISRFIIDVTNVPMYFFANQMFSGPASSGQSSLSSALGASRLENILIDKKDGKFDTESKNNTIPRLIMAIVFMFIFAITLLVLAVMFIIRLIALVILVIFSSVGFIGGVMPGMGGLSQKWWKQFANYALYGPAAMLMLLIATRFFVEFGKEPMFQGMQAVSSGITQDSSMAAFIGSMAMFSIPIVMLWFVIGLAGSFSMVGSGMVVGWGQGLIKSTGKRFGNGAKWAMYKNPVMRGAGEGLKQRYDNNRFVKWVTGPSKTAARMKGIVGTGSAQGELAKLHQKEVNERVKKDKENGINRSIHVKNLGSKDPVEKEAAALALAESKEIRTAGELALAMDALKNNSDGLLRAIENAKPEAIATMDPAVYATARDLHYEKDTAGGFVLDAQGNRVVRNGMDKSLEALNNRTKKEGNIRVQVEYALNQLPSGAAGATPAQVQTAVDDAMKSMKSAKDVANSESLFNDPRYQAAALAHIQARGAAHIQEVKKASAQEGTSVGNLIP